MKRRHKIFLSLCGAAILAAVATAPAAERQPLTESDLG